MAGFNWSDLGKQLMQAGQAYLQEQAQAAIAAEPRVRQLLTTLQQLGTAAPPPPATPAAPHDAFLADAQRFEQWWGLPAPARTSAVQAHLATLDAAGRAQLQAHLQTMQGHVQTASEQHDRAESHSWGGSFEDRISYLDASVRTGQRDPAWLARRRELDGLASALHELLATLAQPQPAASLTPELAAVAELRRQLRDGLAQGQVRPERQLAHEQLLAKIEALMVAGQQQGLSPEEALSQMRELMAEFAPALADPGPARRLHSLRAHTVDAYVGALKAAAAQHLVHTGEGPSQLRLQAVVADLTQSQQALADAHDDDAVLNLERSVLRPAAQRWHASQMSRHALLARPLWDTGVHTVTDANSVFYSGGADAQALLSQVLDAKALHLRPTQPLQSLGQARWDALNRARVAVFDLRGAAEMGWLSQTMPAQARQLATSAYELGLAFALGLPVVVIAQAGEALPFDVDLAPCLWRGQAPEDLDSLAQAVDDALYTLQRSTQRPTLSASLARLQALAAAGEQAEAAQAMGWLDARLASDPAAFAAASQQVLQRLPQSGWRLLHAAWPGSYPVSTQRRCFHVMPFGPSWADGVRDAAQAACEQDLAALGLRYCRGDAAEDGRIIQAIWDDLCQAHAVLVDLSGANLNVMIELGLAHALGRPVLMVQGHDAPPDLVPASLEKLRLLRYGSATELRQLLRERLPGLLSAD